MEEERYTERNTEHYRDRTAAKAMENLIRRKEHQKLVEAVQKCRVIMENHGFEICGKIPIKNKRTGWIYR